MRAIASLLLTILAGPLVAAERIAWLAERFVVTYRHIGEADTIQRQVPPKQKPIALPPEQAISYVCLPDLRVLHVIPGFISADELLREIAWVEAAYSKLLQAAEADQP